LAKQLREGGKKIMTLCAEKLPEGTQYDKFYLEVFIKKVKEP
jgi:hypothetical protein